ncbi:MAG: PIN domain-containing protein, partial [Terriglobia bacterium]
MSTFILDTNIVSYLMRNHSLAQKYRRHLEGHTLAISFMTVGELYEGAFRA